MKQLLNKLSRKFTQTFALLVKSDGTVLLDGSPFDGKAKFFRKIFILEIGTYEEVVESYPITSYFQLAKALLLEQKNLDREFLFEILPLKNGKREVRKAYYKKELIKQTDISPWFIMPASWLCIKREENEALHYVNKDIEYVLPANNSVSVIELSGVLNTPELALESVQGSAEVHMKATTKNTLVTDYIYPMFHDALIRLPLGTRYSNEQSIKFDWKSLSVGFVLVIFSYAIISNLYVMNNLASSKEKNMQLNQELEPIISLVQQNNKSNVKAQALAGLFDAQEWGVEYWKIVSLLLENNVEIENFNLLTSGNILVVGKTVDIQASEVLKKLLEHELVTAAEFNGEVRKRNGEERFRIMCEVVKNEK